MHATIQLPALAGQQGAHPCWSVMLPIRDYLQLTAAPDPDVSPEAKAQRDLSESRAAKIADYLLANPYSRVLPSVTLLVAHATFRDGRLEIPLDASQVSIADGQHRRRALELAVTSDPALARETIPATIFPASDLERAREVFVAINSGAPVPPTIRTFYQPGEKQDVLDAARRAPFAGIIEFVRPNPSPRSGRIWSLTALCRVKCATDSAWWSTALPMLPGFTQVVTGKLSAREARDTYIWAHGVGLEGIGALYDQIPPDLLAKLPEGFWKRSDPRWRNVCTDGTRMLTGTRSVAGITGEVLKELSVSTP